jgi:hypothetical protein
MFPRARSPLHALIAAALSLGAIGCEADGPTATTTPDLKGKGNGSPPSKLLSVSPDYASFPSPLVLEGGSFTYNLDIVNGHQETAEVWVEMRVEQGGTFTAPAASRRLDSFHASCGLGDGVVPRNSVCPMTRTGSVSNSAPGFGTLVPGDATNTWIATYWYKGFDTPEQLGFTFRGMALAAAQ